MTTASAADFLLFAVTSAAAVFFQRGGLASSETASVAAAAACDATTTAGSEEECAAGAAADVVPPKLLNSAFVFVKPHANTPKTCAFVRDKLTDAGIDVLTESDISGEKIDEEKLIDQHYYAIASKATIVPGSEIPVRADKFSEEFGEKWEDVLKSKRACNAMEACERFGCTPSELNDAWQSSKKVVKFGGGFYCGLVTMKGKDPLYVFNAFFMSMRSKFVGKGTSVHCYEVQWDPARLSWSKFRNDLLGPTDPAEAPSGSIRRTILDTYEELGLKSRPNKGDNGVHASASPFEGLAEKSNWLKRPIGDDPFGKALLDAGLSEETIREWSVDPRVELPDGGGKGSVFDALEDMDAESCLEKLVELNKLNEGTI